MKHVGVPPARPPSRPPAPTARPAWSAAHRRRLREAWRSAGWPCHDGIEAELLAAGLLARRFDGSGRDTVFVTDAGIAVLAESRQRHRAAFDAHEALVARVALEMQRAGRIVWRGLALRAPLPADATRGDSDPDGGAETAARTRWVIAMPDVYSIRLTTVEDYAEPAAHEIKVRRADLLSDLRRPDKGAAYRALASQCWYVLARGIAEVDEVPDEYGVMWADEDGLEVARPAPRRGLRVPFGVWMALARADAEPAQEDTDQAPLADGGSRA